MKIKLIITIFIFLSSCFLLQAQLQIIKKTDKRSISMFPHKYSENDTKVAYLIDGKLSNSLFIMSVGENFLDTYRAENKIAIIDGKEYDSQMNFTTKKGYEPKIITIKEIKKKYAKNQNLSCIFFIDGNPIKIVEKNTSLDENNVLEICCHLYHNDEDNLKINVIEIFTKSKQNIEKANTILLD
jgi:hypothetical protein